MDKNSVYKWLIDLQQLCEESQSLWDGELPTDAFFDTLKEISEGVNYVRGYIAETNDKRFIKMLADVNTATLQPQHIADKWSNLFKEYNQWVAHVKLLSMDAKEMAKDIPTVEYSPKLLRLFKDDAILLDEFVSGCKKDGCEAKEICERYKELGNRVIQKKSGERKGVGKTLHGELEKIGLVNIKYKSFMEHL